MARIVDTRNFTVYANREKQRSDLLRSRVTTPASAGLKIERINPLSGASELSFADWSPAKVPETDAEFVNSALEAVAAASQPLGFAPAAPTEFVPDPTVPRTSANSAIVHLQQVHRGIPVFQMTRTIRFGSAKGIRGIVGDNAEIPQDLEIAPRVRAQHAALAAAGHLVATHPEDESEVDAWGKQVDPPAADLTGWKAAPIAAFSLPARPFVLEQGPFAKPPTAHLVVFPTGDEVRLAWYIGIEFTDGRAYAVVVGADAKAETEPDILFAVEKSHQAVSGRVWTESPGRGDRAVVDFPRARLSYPILKHRPLPTEFPGAWCDADETSGLCAHAVGGGDMSPLKGKASPQGIEFVTNDDDEQKIVNIFYFCSYMHDFFYMLGFDEASGNFQSRSQGNVGMSGDAVFAKAHPGAVNGIANMHTPPDGLPPEMNMGAYGDRHTALDADVVFHEYVHGVTNRLVGGRVNVDSLDAPQSGGMGEGWSDYFALTVQSHGRPADKVVTGDWVTNQPGGIRRAPYDDKYPGKYADLGKPPYTRVHAVGEVWCATLMQMNRNFGDTMKNRDAGHRIGWQVVVDALKLTPSNPSFLDARDSILLALDDLKGHEILEKGDHAALVHSAWKSFAQFGMGAKARSSGPTLQGIVADHSMPADV